MLENARAGLASALLLYALGADEETIMADYMLSGESYQKEAGFMAALAGKYLNNALGVSDKEMEMLCEKFLE